MSYPNPQNTPHTVRDYERMSGLLIEALVVPYVPFAIAICIQAERPFWAAMGLLGLVCGTLLEQKLVPRPLTSIADLKRTSIVRWVLWALFFPLIIWGGGSGSWAWFLTLVWAVPPPLTHAGLSGWISSARMVLVVAVVGWFYPPDEWIKTALPIAAIGTVATLWPILDRLRQTWAENDRLVSELRAANARLSGRAREAAAEAHASKAYLAEWSHEIRTSLHGMLGSLALLDSQEFPPQQRELLRAARLGAESLRTQMGNVLDARRTQTEPAARVVYRPARIARQAVDALAPMATTKGLELDLTLNDDLSLVGDPTRVRDILLNLLSNAIKYTPSGRVHLEVAFEEHLILRVQDTGPGIEPELMGRLFDPTVHQPDRDDSSGLGLAIVAARVASLGGSIQAENTATGACFVVRLPRREPEAPNANLRSAVVVDDDVISRKIAKVFFERNQFTVREFETGESALHWLNQHSADLVMVDDNLPGMSGADLTALLQDHPQPPMIIAATGTCEVDRLNALRAAGCRLVLSKPFHPSDLQNALKLALQGT